MSMNPYEVLGVSYFADMPTIKKRFRELCLAYHPDKAKGRGKEFRDVISAFRMIENGWNPAISPYYKHEKVTSVWYQSWDSKVDVQPTTAEFWAWFRVRAQQDEKRSRVNWMELFPWIAFLLLTFSMYVLRPFG